MKTYSSWTTRELGVINPGKGLPLFPSEQFWSLQVMYCDPVGKQEGSANIIRCVKKKKKKKKHLLLSTIKAYADSINWARVAKFWMPILFLTET